MADGVKYDIVEIDQSGRPTAPDKAAKLFISQCGVLVRDCIPITVREWHKPKGLELSADEATQGIYIDDVAKRSLLTKLMAHFNLVPAEEDADKKTEMEEAVKKFALKKMAELFKNHKKRLCSLIKKKKTPDFNAGYEKVKDHWGEFVNYSTE